METILSDNSFFPLFKTPLFQPKPASEFKPISCSLRIQISQSIKQSFRNPNSWFSHVNQGIAALAISLALNFSCPILTDSPAESFVVDDAGVLSRVTKSDLKRLLSDLESRKGYHINSKADAFEYADQVLERWYPTVEEGNNKGIIVLVFSQKEGAITGGAEFIRAVGDSVLDATVSENLPVLAVEEKYNEALFSAAKRLLAAIDGLSDPGGPKAKDSKRESNFKTKEGTEEKRGQFALVVGGLLVIAFVVPMAQYYAYVSKK